MKKIAIIVLLAVFILVFGPILFVQGSDMSKLSYLNIPGMPRGLRNNNPGNLRPLSNGKKWNGEIEPDQGPSGPYSRFSTLYFGTRAMAIDLMGDIFKDQNFTPLGIAKEFSPASDGNVPQEKADIIAKALNCNTGTDIRPFVLTMGPELMGAITVNENGVDPIPDKLYQMAWDAARTHLGV